MIYTMAFAGLRRTEQARSGLGYVNVAGRMSESAIVLSKSYRRRFEAESLKHDMTMTGCPSSAQIPTRQSQKDSDLPLTKQSCLDIPGSFWNPTNKTLSNLGFFANATAPNGQLHRNTRLRLPWSVFLNSIFYLRSRHPRTLFPSLTTIQQVLTSFHKHLGV